MREGMGSELVCLIVKQKAKNNSLGKEIVWISESLFLTLPFSAVKNRQKSFFSHELHEVHEIIRSICVIRGSVFTLWESSHHCMESFYLYFSKNDTPIT
jgi:hypothetical protein